MLTRLDPPIPLDTPKGPGLAYFLIDYSLDFNLMWVVFQDLTGEFWTWDNTQIRAQKNITIGRNYEKEKKDGQKRIHESPSGQETRYGLD
jgi:hypothetical protein